MKMKHDTLKTKAAKARFLKANDPQNGKLSYLKSKPVNNLQYYCFGSLIAI